MVEDFLHQQCTLHRDEHLEVNDDIFNLALNDLQDKVISMGGRQLLSMAFLSHRLWTIIGLQGSITGK